MKSSMKDKVEGIFHEAKGKIKEVAGEITDNPKLETKGKSEKLAEKFRKRSDKSKKFWGVRSAAIARFTNGYCVSNVRLYARIQDERRIWDVEGSAS